MGQSPPAELVESKRKVRVDSVYTCDQLSVTQSLNKQKTLVSTITTLEYIMYLLRFEAQNAAGRRCRTHRV